MQEHRLVISAPFGNYLNFPNCISTLGTFTAKYRGGFAYRIWRMLRTVRYYPRLGAWVNKLGLPNPGIDWYYKRALTGQIDVRDKIVSIAGHNLTDWHTLLTAALNTNPMCVEMNPSCPNCPGEDTSNYEDVFKLAAYHRQPTDTKLIVKLPPIGYIPLMRKALDCGINSFHCCNTLPTPGGGMSGKPLKHLSLQAVRDLHNYADVKGYGLDVVIGGGGVTSYADAQEFFTAGANRVSIGSYNLFPWHWPEIKRIAAQLEKDRQAEEDAMIVASMQEGVKKF